MKSVCHECERIPLPIREAHDDNDAVRAPNTEADPVALGSPRTEYWLVSGKEQAPLQERISGKFESLSRWEIWGGAMP
jgi:hypothetical protein